ncbi:MAG: GntR family transcriptional regulator [Pseudomonadota bacterium]
MAGKHDQIAGALIQDILDARYRVNERLPSERDLAARFDANRGAVREAMKKLEQIGLAEIQPGGARVKSTNEASLDVIGHMLAEGQIPDQTLVDQILVVISALMGIAAEQVLEIASDEEIENIRTLTRPLYTRDLGPEAHTLARFELFQAIMLTSDNLPLQLIARTLFEQFAPNMRDVIPSDILDYAAFGECARQIDTALGQRDLPAIRQTFSNLSSLNREAMMRALETARTNLPLEVSYS